MRPSELRLPSATEIEAARVALKGLAVRTPLVPYGGSSCGSPEQGPSGTIHLKLENLQPIRSFKLRGAGNALLHAEREALREGVVTASAGNMAQGVAWCAREMGFACRVVVPDHAPQSKLEAIDRLGGTVRKVPFAEWWEIIETGEVEDPGFFLHPVCDTRVMAGNGTIGLEILEDLPAVATVLVPFGGGGLISGVATAVKAHRSDVRVLACEVETAAPLTPSLAAGEIRSIEYQPSFIDGIGGRSVLSAMWPLVREVVDGTVVVSLAEVKEAMRLMLRHNCVVPEGAGAVPLAAALSGRAGEGPLVCIVSGGNIDLSTLAAVLGED